LLRAWWQPAKKTATWRSPRCIAAGIAVNVEDDSVDVGQRPDGEGTTSTWMNLWVISPAPRNDEGRASPATTRGGLAEGGGLRRLLDEIRWANGVVGVRKSQAFVS
jgi:hypothetical protein